MPQIELANNKGFTIVDDDLFQFLNLYPKCRTTSFNRNG
jgi:hypothetical protein